MKAIELLSSFGAAGGGEASRFSKDVESAVRPDVEGAEDGIPEDYPEDYATGGIRFACYIAAELFDFMSVLSEEMQRLGARECFLGHPMPDQLMFDADEESYSFDFALPLYQGLVKLFDDSDCLSVRLDNPDIERVELNLTSNGDHPIVHMVLCPSSMELAADASIQ